MRRLGCVGHAAERDSVVLHGDVDKPEFLAYYVKSRRVAAAAGLGRGKGAAALMRLFTIRRDSTAADLGGSPAAVLAAAQRTALDKP